MIISISEGEIRPYNFSALEERERRIENSFASKPKSVAKPKKMDPKQLCLALSFLFLSIVCAGISVIL